MWNINFILNSGLLFVRSISLNITHYRSIWFLIVRCDPIYDSYGTQQRLRTRKVWRSSRLDSAVDFLYLCHFRGPEPKLRKIITRVSEFRAPNNSRARCRATRGTFGFLQDALLWEKTEKLGLAKKNFTIFLRSNRAPGGLSIPFFRSARWPP